MFMVTDGSPHSILLSPGNVTKYGKIPDWKCWGTFMGDGDFSGVVILSL